MKQSFLFLFFTLTVFAGLSAQNNSLHFDGVNDYIQVDDITLPVKFTIEYQFKAGSNSQVPFEERIIGLGPTNRLELGLEEGFSGTRLWVYDQNNGFNSIESEINPRDGEWHHLAITQDGETAKIYYDGELVTEYPIVFTDDLYGPSLRIGAWTGGLSTGTFFTGEVDEVRIWLVARTAEEIASAFDCQISGEEEGLYAYWDFNQGVAGGTNSLETTLVDRTGNNVGGELTNFSLLGSNSNWVDSGNPDILCDFVSGTQELRPELWSVYPNPTADKVQIRGVSAEASTLEIYNQQGVRLQQLSLNGAQEVDLGRYPAGMYFLMLTQESGRAVYKLMKQ